jgi:hypothetical protein
VSVWDIELYVQFALFLGMAVLEIFALVDALLRPAAAYVAAGKLTKPAWLLILALALVTCLAFRSPMSILGLIGLVGSGVYLADVRPAIAEITRR